nr:DUF559 domain-containing protein [uncultured Draconibacterium sp.]
MSKTNNLNGYSFVERLEIRKFYSRPDLSGEANKGEKTMAKVAEEMIRQLKEKSAPAIYISTARNCFEWKFSPLEYQCWCEIKSAPRCRNFVPEYPIGKYFVDFADPVHRVVIECDGRKYHQDKTKDQNRQQFIESLGWTVFRFDAAQIFSNIYDNVIVPRMDDMIYESLNQYQSDIEQFKTDCMGCFLRSNEFTNELSN